MALIVDDDDASATECAFALGMLGYDPVIAQDANDALALAASHPVAIAIVDLDAGY